MYLRRNTNFRARLSPGQLPPAPYSDPAVTEEKNEHLACAPTADCDVGLAYVGGLFPRGSENGNGSLQCLLQTKRLQYLLADGN